MKKIFNLSNCAKALGIGVFILSAIKDYADDKQRARDLDNLVTEKVKEQLEQLSNN